MFELPKSEGAFSALAYLVKSNLVRVMLYCGAVPFAVVWIVRGSLQAGFALQVYLVTAGVFLDGPFHTQRDKVGKLWFWKAMLKSGVIVHPLVLAGMWFLDVAYPFLVQGTATLILFVLAISVAEAILLDTFVDRSQPPFD